MLKNKVELPLNLKPVAKFFTNWFSKKTEIQVSYLKSQLRYIQTQLSHQERIFARIEIRQQGRTLLEYEYKNLLGCLGVYQCDNCRANYSAENNQAVEISQ